ncbi:rab11 family-interacting protein 5 [Pseudophryne corroboree]|uniref:rab11 family-interacting protein 5 n=1 Tax=Pseudophryne corroboree TaxID=495146 RepID=UPI0030820B9C
MFLRPEPELGWLPTHVQVTILQARGLRAKGKHGTSDAYTLIQVGREKYSTSVVEKTPGSPEWKEECSFELSPGAIERGENSELKLIVMHRALIGMDQFLGQVSVPLQGLFQEGRSKRDQWYKLHSKTGKKEKERGEIQVSIQFTRNNLTASMFDLSVKDKPKTPFGKLKDKMKVKKHFDMESSSAIVPSSVGRLDSDEEDEKKPKFKAAAFFKGRLRKSSLTKSNTSLGSDSTISSTSGTAPTSAGITINLPDVIKKPAVRNSSLSTEPTVNIHEASPRMTHKRAFSDEVSQLKLFPEPKAVQNLKPDSSPISKSSLCINGSHVYTEVPLPKPPVSLEKAAPASKSFQNIVKKADEAAVPEVTRGPVHTLEKVGHKSTGLSISAEGEMVSSKAVAASQKPKNDQVLVDSKPVQITSPMVFTADLSKIKVQEAKTKEEKPAAIVQQGSGKSQSSQKNLTETSPQVPSSSEERGKVGSWFGSKDTKETPPKPSFPSGSIGTSEAAERNSSLAEEHSPVAFSPFTEDQKVFSYPGESGFLQAFAENRDFSLAQSSSLEPPALASELEEQFDAFASSRLQPSSNNRRPSETKDKSFVGVSMEHLLQSSSEFQGTEPTTHRSDDNPWNLHSKNPNVQTLGTCWPEMPDVGRRETEEISPFPKSLSQNFSPAFIPPSESPRNQTLITDTTNRYAQVNVDLPLPESNTTSNVLVGAIPGESRIAAISPRVVIDQNTISLEENIGVSLCGQESPTQRKYPTSLFPINETVLQFNKGSGIVEHVLDSVELKEQAHIEQRFFAFNQEVIPSVRTLMEERVKELIKEQAINEDIGSTAPPKPSLLMLSPALERLETSNDDCKQTSNQETTEKQRESPEVHMKPQNMGDSKQTVSPVACCPVIEMQSPVLGSIGEDTQSATEGLWSNLGEGINEVSKLGAANGEHLLDVNEVTASEQFRTCPSNVSLDTDLSSLQEASNKLHLINHGPSEVPSTLGHSKQDKDDFNFLKPVLLSNKESRTEIACLAKKCDQSDFLFWSALEEQIPPSMVDPADTRQDLSKSPCPDVHSESSTKPEQSKGEVLASQSVEPIIPPLSELLDHRLESSMKSLREESQSGLLLSQQSSWSADIVVDFKNEGFWRIESDQLDHIKCFPSPGNPFTPVDRAPLSPKNPFIDLSRDSLSSGSSLPEDLSFKDLHAHAALRDIPSAILPAEVKDAFMHGSPPLAFSTPSLDAAPNPTLSDFPSPIMFPTTSGVTIATSTRTSTLSCCQSSAASGGTSHAPSVLPQETQTADNPFMPLRTSPHPVKPISAALSDSAPEKKPHRPALTTALNSGLEKLKSVTGGQHSVPKKQELERLKDLCPPDLAAKYYHLTHDELIHMLLQREVELGKKEDHVRELETYIDKLLVRIMEQAPALLQAPLETKK